MALFIEALAHIPHVRRLQLALCGAGGGAGGAGGVYIAQTLYLHLHGVVTLVNLHWWSWSLCMCISKGV